ncbi:serine/threonine-protein kinase SBK1-like [Limulus polyphemus]|uniref:Serine/threonine-protein kinase SBK1-like n=1 Tax=Limulus polyphemus TaxID=6850 RepID=A0ABM1SWF8_LIMPO|nr:serine/threonine-protein kinase SBK1-like [Limulus polyphemus]
MNPKRTSSIHKIRDIHLQRIDLNDQYDILREIGSGDYGKVVLAVLRERQEEVALKIVPKATTSSKDFQIEFHYSYFLSPHINILNTYDVAFETTDYYIFAQEVAPSGDLWQVIEKQNGMEENDVKLVVKQVTSALEFMHSKDLVHRDVRAENVLIFQTNFTKVKLTDFGLTRRAGTLVKKRTRSLPTCPPEIWETVHMEGYNVEIGSDVWQMGMLIFAALFANFPWQKADITDPDFRVFMQWQKRKTTRIPKKFKIFTPRLLRLYRRLMDAKPSKRYEITEVYKYVGDKWLVPRSSRTSNVSKTPEPSDHSEVREETLEEILSNFGLKDHVNKDDKEQRVYDWILSSTKDKGS